ncbi:hypothetical protein GDO78_005927 [Eleutherodactylus coqui]|uniref:Uncharacterized protein n=1 Tax=Eleutherodactylus coqui TaxID=57060 RepID=A0A8J6FNT3_ELECQ|nr:hypothetical protein GDO78_005927 [Eleutherodactylus coqui]
MTCRRCIWVTFPSTICKGLLSVMQVTMVIRMFIAKRSEHYSLVNEHSSSMHLQADWTDLLEAGRHIEMAYAILWKDRCISNAHTLCYLLTSAYLSMIEVQSADTISICNVIYWWM